jgi:hypothetical protein
MGNTSTLAAAALSAAMRIILSGDAFIAPIWA